MDTFLSDDKRFITIRECTQEEYEAVKTAYTKKAEGYRYNPLYKKKLWDGNVTYFKGANLPSGTWSYLIDISKQCGWKLKIDGLRGLFDNDITLESYTEWVDKFFADLPFTPRDYQIKSAYKILRFRKCLSELATSAGKTLICFMVLAYLIDKHIIKGKVLMIVPTVQLVLQSSGDFEEYNTDKLPLIIQQIYAGFKIKPDANIYVGTYQTLTKMDEAWFKQFDCVVVDECLHPTTMITMSDGSLKPIQDICVGESVMTYNEALGVNEPKNVDFVYKNLSSHDFLYEIEMENGKIIKLTENHKVLLSDGTYKRADELTIDDDVVSY